MARDTYLYGASGHCKVIIDIFKKNNIAIKAIVDDNPKQSQLFEIPIIKSHDFSNDDNLVISIGNNKVRQKLSRELEVNFTTAIHPTAVISPSSKIGNGSVVMAGTIINADTTIGEHCIINSGAIVEHDNNIANFVHISPGAALAGNVTVGEGSHIGINATIIQGITIGKWVTVGAGAVIINDIPDNIVVVGNPGKIIKYN